MADNIFEEFQEKKKQITLLADKAREFGLITQEREKEIIKKIESDTLTIGVIGQMKAGKSTFLNAFVFGHPLLPSATTPMTAALSVIAYGEKPKVVADFYSESDWADQQFQAKRNIDEVTDESEKSKIKAAKELTQIAEKKLGSSLSSLLGKQQEDLFENLEEYVGADGKFVGITKSVTIYYPKDYLKGVNIVDTPGVNDPIVSREERTKKFLQQCDVVILMLYAQRSFDATDRSLLFDNVHKCGIGKVLIGINKYDICIEDGETEEEIIENTKENIKKGAQNNGDDTLQEMIKSITPIPLSAEAALLSQIGSDKIAKSEEYSHAIERYTKIWDDVSPAALKKISRIESLENAVIDIINHEKGAILFARPKAEIMSAVKEKMSQIETQMTLDQNKIKNLSMPDQEIENKLDDLNSAKRRMERKLKSFKNDFCQEMEDNLIPNIDKDLMSRLRSFGDKLLVDIDGLSTFRNMKYQTEGIKNKIQTFGDKTLPDIAQEKTKMVKKKLQSFTSDYFDDVEELIMDKLPDLDFYDFLSDIKSKIEIETNNKFDYEMSDSFGRQGIIQEFIMNFGGLLGSLIFGGEQKQKLKNDTEEWINQVSFSGYIDELKSVCNKVLDIIENEGVSIVINPLIESLEECKNNKAKREQELIRLQSEVENLTKQKALLKTQSEEIEKIVNGL